MSSSTNKKIDENIDYYFCIVILGDRYSGKSCIVQRYVYERFWENHTLLLGPVYEIKFAEIYNKKVKLKIYDRPNTSGRFGALSKKWFNIMDGAIIVYDFYYSDTLDNLKKQIEEIKLNAVLDTQIILFANRFDSEKNLEEEEKVKKLADEYGIKHIEVSAKTGYNINEGFNSLVNDMITASENPKGNNIMLENTDDKNNKRKKCA